MSEFAPLGQLVSIKRGTTYKSRLLGQPGPVLLGLASIARNGGFRGGSLKTYGGGSPPELLVRPGGIYASLKDVTQSADLLGSVARLPNGGPVGRLTQDTVRLDLVSDGVTSDFLYWSLQTPNYRDYCRRHSTGTTTLGLPRDDFLSYPIWLPSIDEQRRIAGVLGALDDLAALEDSQADASEDLARAVASSATGSIALRALGRDVRSPIRPSSSCDHYSLPAFDDGARPKREDGSSIKSGKNRIEVPSVLVSRLNPHIPRIWMAYPDRSIPAVASTEFVVIEPVGVPVEWIWAAASSPNFVAQMQGRVTGTTGSHQRVDKADLLNLLVPDPSDASPAQVGAVVALVQDAHEARIEATRLQTLRDELLPLLVSGRVRVGEGAV